ncbi:MAG: multiple sugar transport system substrate-binding protein [Actinomycetota bacterium]|nr:multiple sugar transport system substrate-binding protein [Actinomycetota bacterium]MEA2844698.1 multiple sugar transport system substrate-binding protein [Actinomycetota bacterium]
MHRRGSDGWLPTVAPRNRLWATAVLVVALVVAGCSATPATPPTTLKVLMTDDWVTAPFIDAVREFERTHPNVRVAVDKGPIGLQADVVRAGTSSGAAPDVVQGHAFSAANQGLAQPLDDVWQSKLNAEEFSPGALEDVTWNGMRYGVPLDTNAMVLMYNVDHFKEAGVPEPDPKTPMSLQAFADLARSLTKGDRRALAIPTSNWWTYGWIKADAGELVQVGSDGKSTLTLDDPKVVAGVAFLADLIDKNLAFPPRGVDAHSDDAFALFGAGRVSMHTSGSWDIANIKKRNLSINYRTVLMPQEPGGGTVMGGSSMWVPVASRNRDLAVEFMTLLASDPYALRFAKEEGRLPVRLRVFDDPYFSDPDRAVFLEQLKTAHPHKLEAYPEASADFAFALDEVLGDRKDPGEALRAAQLKAQTDTTSTTGATSPP